MQKNSADLFKIRKALEVELKAKQAANENWYQQQLAPLAEDELKFDASPNKSYMKNKLYDAELAAIIAPAKAKYALRLANLYEV